jgi:hypothetical protein
MSASRQPAAAEAAAFRILSSLDIYEDDLRVLTEGPRPECQRRLAAQIEAMRSEATLLPQLVVPWIEFLISHERLIQSLAIDSSLCDRLDALEKHIGLLLKLQGECLKLLTRKRQILYASRIVTRQQDDRRPCAQRLNS